MIRSWMRTCVSLVALAATPALAGEWKANLAEKGVSLEASYTVDILSVSGAGNETAVLDNLDVIVDVDLEAVMGWKGATLHLYGLSNGGDMPNDAAGTLEGIDNIEVGLHRAKLYEFWLQQTFLNTEGHGVSLLAGLYDLNSEFYATGASDVFIHPAFGIGSELAATGVNGPSIFPSTALTVRAKAILPHDGYVQLAAINGRAGTVNDPDGVDTDFDNILMVAEAGVDGDRKFAIGAWSYSERFEDTRDVDIDDNPVMSEAYGLYALVDVPLWARNEWAMRGFLRGGVSDGDTGDFDGSWQAGVTVAGLFGRENGVLGFGVHQGMLASKYRANVLDADSIDLERAETGFELTYSDQINDHIIIQPDVQYILNPGGDSDADDILVVGTRVTLTL